jgi:Ser/Thr protein kinase RdoA (MazF antagonist)
MGLLSQKFEPAPDDIKRACRFFGIGPIRREEKEKEIRFPHANVMVLVTTDLGRYVIKFFSPNDARKIAFEYAVNRILAARRFPTPLMHAGTGGRPFMDAGGRLAACYSYIDGCSAWKVIRQKNTICRINMALLSLKNILSSAKIGLSWPRNESLGAMINLLTRYARAGVPFEGKKIIEKSLLKACRTYQRHRRLFSRQRLHSDANLTNFLICDESAYVLDLEHVREDYALSDLSSLLVSCILSLPPAAIKAMVKDYFNRHELSSEYSSVLDTLVTLGLVREFFASADPERKAPIISLLIKLNDDPGFIP